VNKRINPNYGYYAIRSLAIRFIEASENGKHFMVTNGTMFLRARKIAKENGVIIKYDRKNADYFAIKEVVGK